MTPEMIEAADKLQKAALNYKQLFQEETGKVNPVVWIIDDREDSRQFRAGVFIMDSFNTQITLNQLQATNPRSFFEENHG